MRSRNQIIKEMTKYYISQINMNNIPEPAVIETELIEMINDQISLENQMLPKGMKYKFVEYLEHDQIARLMLATNYIRSISCGYAEDAKDLDVLAIYQEEGVHKGTYRSGRSDFHKIAVQYNLHLSKKGLDEVIDRLRIYAPRAERCMDRDLIAVNNGIFNYKTKKLQDFTPEMIFLSKVHVDYNHAAQNIVIHNDVDGTDWDVESWMKSLSDDPQIVELLWQILGALVRPFVSWNKSAWLYSERGNNGKGTLCELMRGIVGEAACASIPLNSFSKEYALEPLTRATAIIVDENDVGTFIDKAARIKSLITHEPVEINRKYMSVISYRSYAFMVQCLNEFPRIRDKTKSNYRRYLFIPFDKCFEQCERKYIKADYLHRKEVLEYCLYRVLHMNYYEFSVPKSCERVLTTYMEYNDTVRQFWEETKDEFKWELLPYSFLYDLYKSWFRKNNPSGRIEGKTTFIGDIKNVVDENEWEAKETNDRVRVGNRMNGPEPLIGIYDLVDWKNPYYMGGDPYQICLPRLADSYAGLLRRKVVGSN